MPAPDAIAEPEGEPNMVAKFLLYKAVLDQLPPTERAHINAYVTALVHRVMELQDYFNRMDARIKLAETKMDEIIALREKLTSER